MVTSRLMPLVQYLVVGMVFCFLLFVLVHPIKYALFFFGTTLTVILYLVIFKHNSTKFQFTLSSGTLCGYIEGAFIACSIAILLLNIFPNTVTPIRFILSLTVSLLLPGWVLIKMLRIDGPRNTKLSMVVLSFVLSIGLSSCIFLASLALHQQENSIFLPTIYVIISLLPMLTRNILYRLRQGDKLSYYARKKNYNLINIIAIFWMICFFVYTISILYPQMGNVPGYDIVRHFSASRGLVLTNPLYSSVYPWYHFSLASIMQLSQPPMLLFQTGIAYLSVILIISFYVMANAYLKDIDSRAPILSTIFFFVFSGFGWLYFFGKLPELPGISAHLDLLNLSSIASYWDISLGQSPWLWLWFRPLTLGATIITLLFYMMRRDDLPKFKFILIDSLLMLILTQVHLSEVLLFVVFICALALLLPSMKLRIKETAISTVIGLGTSLILMNVGYLKVFGTGFFVSANQYSSNQFVVISILVTALAYFLSSFKRRPRLPNLPRIINVTVIASIILFIYFVFIVHWFITAPNFHIAEIFAVPSQFYPVLLGIVGAFAIPSIVIVIKKYREHPILIFVIFFVLMIIFGRILTAVNANFVSNDQYSERRIIPFVFISCSLLSPILVLEVMERLKTRLQKVDRFGNLTDIMIFASISLFVIGGVFSTFLTIEYQLLYISKIGISNDESKLQKPLFGADPYSTLLTLTSRSKDIAEYANLGYIIGFFKYQIWPSKSPELPLHILSVLNSSSILFITPSDQHLLVKNKYDSGYVASHLLKVAPRFKESSSGQISLMPRLVPPSPKSDTVLVLPEENQKYIYYAYDIMSLAGYNYTTVLLSDINSMSRARTIVVPTENMGLKILDYRSRHNLEFEKLIVLNLDGYGSLSRGIGHVRNNIDMNNSSSWVPTGTGSGSIGIPKLSYEADFPFRPDRPPKIEVSSGNYSLWQISKLFHDKPLNLSKFDFVKFDWYGKGDGKWYVLQFTSGPDSYFWYRFQDSWTGWKKVILPLHISDGTSESFGVAFDKATRSGSNWSHINKIDVRTEASNKNQRGTFYIDGLDFDKMSNSSSIIAMNTGQKIPLPASVKLFPTTPIHRNETLALFSGTAVPLLSYIKGHSYDLYYLNAIPIAAKLESQDYNSTQFYPFLGKLISLINNSGSNYEFEMQGKTNIANLVSGGVAAFKDAEFVGNITLQTSSALIKLNSSRILVNLGTKNFVMNDVKEIIPIDTKTIGIWDSTGGVLKQGLGFYSRIVLDAPLFKYNGNPSTISIVFTNGSTLTLKSKEIQIYLPKSDIILRQPSILVNGIVYFTQFYAYGELSNKLKSLGADLKIDGKVYLRNQYSDEFTVTQGITLEGKISGIPQKYSYNELSNLLDIFQYSNIRHILAILVIFIVIDIFILKRNQRKGITVDKT